MKSAATRWIAIEAALEAAFKAIDLDAVVAVAKASILVNKSVRLGVVSAMGADARRAPPAGYVICVD